MSPSARARGREHLAAAAVFAAVLLVFFAPALVGGRAFTVTAAQQDYVLPWAAQPHGYPPPLQSDQADLSLPALRVQQRAYETGELPEVDLFSYGGGYPLFADFATGQAYPPRMLVATLFDPLRAHLAFTLLHLFAAGWFTYLLARRLAARWLTGVLAGSSWMLGAWTTGWMHLAPFLVVSALLPAGLWAMHRASRRPSLANTVLCGSLLGAEVIAGQALFGIVGVTITGLYGLGLVGRELLDRRRSGDGAVPWRTVAVVPASGLLAVLLWAFILLPLALAMPDAARASLRYEELKVPFVAPPSFLLNMVWPFPAPIGISHIGATSFVGFVTGAAAVVGLWTRRPGSGLGRAVVLILGSAMIGGPMTWLFFHAVPTMQLFRPYARFAFFIGFGVVLLAVAGAECIADRVGRLAMPPRGRVRTALAGVAVVLVAANALHLGQLGRANNPELPPDDEAAFFPETPFTRALVDAAGRSPNGWPGRAAILRPQEQPGDPWSPPILWGAQAAYVGVESTGGYNATLPRRSEQVLRLLAGEGLAPVLERDTIRAFQASLPWGRARYDLFARHGYDLVVTPPSVAREARWRTDHVDSGELTSVYEGPDGAVFRIAGATAGAHGVARLEVVAGDTAALERFNTPSFDPRWVLVTPADAERLGPIGEDGSLRVATVADATRGANGYRFTTDAEADTLVVVPVNWGAGWTARAGDRELPLVRANDNQLVVRIPAGRSEVALEYRAPGLRPGAVISGLTGVVVVAAFAVSAGRRRSRRAPRDPAGA